MTMNLIRNAAVTAAAAALTTAFGCMDAEPSLWLWEKVVSHAHLERSFGNKRIWITGASSGIGKALAIQLDQCGAHLILSSRNQEALQDVADACKRGNGDNTRILPLDVTNRQHVQDAVALVGDDLDILILNAGIGQLQPASQSDMATAEQLFAMNTFAPMYMASLIPWTKKQQQHQQQQQQRYTGHIVVTSSVASKFAVPLSAAYAASKHAVHGYFQSLKSECPWLRIDLPCPGPTQTHFFGKTTSQEDTTLSSDSSSSSSSSQHERKMSAERCARLILVSMSMKQDGERWIAQQPTLAFLYLNQWCPSLATFLLNQIGPTRWRLWEAGLNLYDPSSFSKLRALDKERGRE